MFWFTGSLESPLDTLVFSALFWTSRPIESYSISSSRESLSVSPVASLSSRNNSLISLSARSLTESSCCISSWVYAIWSSRIYSWYSSASLAIISFLYANAFSDWAISASSFLFIWLCLTYLFWKLLIWVLKSLSRPSSNLCYWSSDRSLRSVLQIPFAYASFYNSPDVLALCNFCYCLTCYNRLSPKLNELEFLVVYTIYEPTAISPAALPRTPPPAPWLDLTE